MPKISIVLYKEVDGTVPLLEWFAGIPEKAQDRCRVKIEHLAACGHELRRPDCENLGNGIYELRAQYQHLNLRILYFFYGSEAVVLSHGITKQQARVSSKDIRMAQARKQRYEANPKLHRAEE